ncbi:olfactory receptor 52E5-like [Discoglossus pictus]
MANTSDVIEFVLIGFPGLPEKFHILVSFVMFLVYVIAMLANGTVLILIFLKNHLHHPMYIIIGNLAFSDLLFDTSTLPKMIGIYWFGGGSISFSSQVPLIINGDLKVVILCIYTFVPHVANPIIYCLRTQEIKRTLGNVFKVKMNKTEDLQAAQ